MHLKKNVHEKHEATSYKEVSMGVISSQHLFWYVTIDFVARIASNLSKKTSISQVYRSKNIILKPIRKEKFEKNQYTLLNHI